MTDSGTTAAAADWQAWQCSWDRQQEWYMPDREERFRIMLDMVEALVGTAPRVLDLAWIRRIRLRRITLICDRLTHPQAQRPLFAAERRQMEKEDRLVTALDRIRRRFGTEALAVGRTLAA